jgi:hypothetical protein
LDQRANLENNARDLLQQTAGKVSSRLDDWRSTRKRFQPAQEVVDAPQIEKPAPPPPEPAARPVRAPARPRARAAPRRQVTVYLDSIPTGATVIGPDGPLGTTPLSHKLSLQSTTTFTFKADGFETVSRTVKATKRFDSVLVKLPSKPGE